MTGTSSLRTALDSLRATELDALGNRLYVGRFHGADDEPATRHGVQRALSGLLWGEIDILAGDKLCLPERETDFALPGRLPIRWSRFYSSALTAEGVLGVGWRVSWEVTLKRSDDQLAYTDEYGRVIVVPCPAPGARVIVLSERLQVACLSDGTMVVADFTPRYRVFGKFDEQGLGRLKYIEDAGGERIGCIWSESGHLTKMRGTCGHELRMHYGGAGRRLTAIESVGDGPGGFLVQYHYDEGGQLAQVQDRMGATTRRFRYEAGRMVEDTGVLGAVTRYVWETTGGKARVVERSTDAGARDQFSYREGERASDVCDAFGSTAHWRYDSFGCVLAHRDFDGSAYAFEYGKTRWPVALTLPGDRRIVLARDNLSRIIRETGPAGQARQTTYAFGTLEPLMIRLEDGRAWRWMRNDRLQPIQYQPPSGETIRIEYDDKGEVVRHVDGNGGVTVLERDAAGRVVRKTDARGRRFDYTYDAGGNIASIRDALGAVTRVECNVLGWPLSVIRPDGRSERHGWNALGQRVAFTGADGQTRQWQRDGRGRVIREVDEEGHAIVHEYDAHGRRVRTTSGNGAVQTFEWDAVGRLRAMTDENGVTRAFAYTDHGAVAQATETAGPAMRGESFSYDKDGRLTGRQTRHSTYAYAYTALGQLESVTRTPTAEGEALGVVANSVRFEYGPNGRLLGEEAAHGKLRFGHDSAGNLGAVLLPQQQQLQLVRDNDGAVTLIGLNGRHIAQFHLDAMKRETLRLQGNLLTYMGRDELGEPLWWRAVLADETEHRELTPGDIRIWREVRYGPGGQVTQANDHLHGTSYFDYDRCGNLLRRVSDELGVERFSWDGSGNPIDATQAHWGQLKRADHRLAEHAGWRYEYDVWGQVTRKSGNRPALTLEWDAEGHLLAARQRDQVVRYQYDALGRCIVKTTESVPAPGRVLQAPAPRVTRFVWLHDQLIQELQGERVRTYVYCPAGAGHAGDVPLACIDQVLNDDGEPQDPEVLHFQTDAAGTAVGLTNETGTLVWSARYRVWGNLLMQEGRLPHFGQPLRLAGHYADEDTGLHWHGRRVYDPDVGRYLAPERGGLGGGNPYRHAAGRRARMFACPAPFAPDLPDAGSSPSQACPGLQAAPMMVDPSYDETPAGFWRQA